MFFIVLLTIFPALLPHAQCAEAGQHYLIPKGVIVLWSGDENRIPEGWVICDGKNDSPDLRDRFVIGSGFGAAHKAHSIGGSSSATPIISVQGTVLSEAQLASHTHDDVTGIEDNESIYYDVEAVPKYFVTTSQTHIDSSTRFLHIRRQPWENCTSCQHRHTIKSSGQDQPHSHVAISSEISLTPQFYALAYIMKL